MNNGKILCALRCLIVVIVLFNCVCVFIVDETAFADGNPILTLTQSGELAVEVKLSNNTGLYAANFTLSYDENLLTYNGYDRGSALADMELVATGSEVASESICFNFLSKGTFNDASNGRVLTLYFSPNNGAVGTADVTLTYKRGSDVLMLSNGAAVAQNVLVEGVVLTVNVGSNELLLPVIVATASLCVLAITSIFVLCRRNRTRFLTGDDDV